MTDMTVIIDHKNVEKRLAPTTIMDLVKTTDPAIRLTINRNLTHQDSRNTAVKLIQKCMINLKDRFRA